jgi:hypothetical protein
VISRGAAESPAEVLTCCSDAGVDATAGSSRAGVCWLAATGVQGRGGQRGRCARSSSTCYSRTLHRGRPTWRGKSRASAGVTRRFPKGEWWRSRVCLSRCCQRGQCGQLVHAGIADICYGTNRYIDCIYMLVEGASEETNLRGGIETFRSKTHSLCGHFVHMSTLQRVC